MGNARGPRRREATHTWVYSYPQEPTARAHARSCKRENLEVNSSRSRLESWKRPEQNGQSCCSRLRAKIALNIRDIDRPPLSLPKSTYSPCRKSSKREGQTRGMRGKELTGRRSSHHAIQMAPKKTESVKKLVHLTRELSEQLRTAAYHSRHSQSDIVRQALVLWFAREAKKH